MGVWEWQFYELLWVGSWILLNLRMGGGATVRLVFGAGIGFGESLENMSIIIKKKDGGQFYPLPIENEKKLSGQDLLVFLSKNSYLSLFYVVCVFC